jgi:hypothetical protein
MYRAVHGLFYRLGLEEPEVGGARGGGVVDRSVAADALAEQRRLDVHGFLQ